MAQRDEIFNELREISITVANLGNVMPFHVPAGYFEALPAQFLNSIKNSDVDEDTLPWAKPARNEPFEVPLNYFDGLAETILNRIKGNEASSHVEEIKIISPLLGKLDKKLPFNMPGGYFEEFPGDVMAGVNAIEYVNRELETSSSTFNDLRDKNVFEVPQGYFDHLADELLAKAKDKQTGRIFHLAPARKIIRYAVAALLAGVISVSAWIFFHDRPTLNAAADLTGIEKISDDEMETYLESSSVAPAESNTELNSIASFDLKEEDVKELLADVSDEELQEYLDQQGLSKDLKTN